MIATLRDVVLIFERVPLLFDNTFAISMAKNPILYSKTKDIGVHLHFQRDHCENAILIFAM
jgi:hypothetical protein